MFLRDEICKSGENVVVCDLARDDMSRAVENAFRYDRLVLATTTYNSDIFPFMREFINELTERGFKDRRVAIIENGSWAPMAAKKIRNMLECSKNINYTDITVTIRSALSAQSREQLKSLAKELCE